jgi:DNA invertase Pin-like site-specific DNA recombinase
MNDARRQTFDVIAVWKLDRFGRSLRHLANAIVEVDALGIASLILAMG